MVYSPHHTVRIRKAKMKGKKMGVISANHHRPVFSLSDWNYIFLLSPAHLIIFSYLSVLSFRWLAGIVGFSLSSTTNSTVHLSAVFRFTWCTSNIEWQTSDAKCEREYSHHFFRVYVLLMFCWCFQILYRLPLLFLSFSGFQSPSFHLTVFVQVTPFMFHFVQLCALSLYLR